MLRKILQLVSDHLYFFSALFFCSVSYWGIWRKNAEQKKAQKLLVRAVKNFAAEPMTLHPEIDAAKCAGCGACTKVCPEGDILKLINHKAVLVSPTKCLGHGECERACPFSAISLVFGTKTRGVEIPRVNGNYETNIPGLYIAGELGGMGLIRNAFKQGVLAVEHGVKNLNKNTLADYDFIIVGAGPAGIAASLASVANKVKYLCFEQGSFGGTIYNFPRQKVVMTHPADLPMFGQMKFDKNRVSKEELLAYWNDVRKKANLRISEHEKFETVEKKDEVFHVKTSKGVYTSRKVILSMGVRGSPRRLGLPNEGLPKVTYNLLDPQQYQRKNVAVVGGGNAGVEAAQMLAKAEYGNKVTLIVHGGVLDRCNQENQNIIERMRKQGLVEIWYHSSAQVIEPDHLMVVKEKQIVRLENDFLFIFIGSEMPLKFLMSLGVAIDKKFGEGLGIAKSAS